MNEQLQNALQQFLLKLVEGVEKAGEFTIEQVPDVIQQALFWFALKSSVLFLIGLSILAFNAWFQYKVYNKKNGWCHKTGHDGISYYYYHEDTIVTSFIFGCVFLLIGIIFTVSNLEWLQILVAPKWFIVSEMSKLL